MRYHCTELTNLDTNADLFAMMNDYWSRVGDRFGLVADEGPIFLALSYFDHKASMTTPDIPFDG